MLHRSPVSGRVFSRYEEGAGGGVWASIWVVTPALCGCLCQGVDGRHGGAVSRPDSGSRGYLNWECDTPGEVLLQGFVGVSAAVICL